MAIRSWTGAIAALLIAGAVAGCGSTPTPSPSPSAPASVASLTPVPSASSSPSPSPSAATSQVYVVRKGDTLIGIATRFHITLAALKKANPAVTDPTKLKIGLRLVIPSA